ncbi:MAG: EVE domain-containing protein [Gammaproteobacteria bacterium]|nr:EVE domain-containing protein [Gammaproteobacteria bacterium]MBI5615120.1 EVE domain-containing protein [Gammaproteobacteria bacterium]
MRYWLMKSEPASFSLDTLKACPKKTTMWDGVRNYQARNFLRDEFERGDLAFFYHSSCEEPGIVGIVEVVKEAYPDPTALDPENHHYDPREKAEAPRWFVVDVKLKRALKRTIGLAELKTHEALAGMRLLATGNRLSVMPVSAEEWRYILALE